MFTPGRKGHERPIDTVAAYYTYWVFNHISPVWSYIVLWVGIQPPGKLLYGWSHGTTELRGRTSWCQVTVWSFSCFLSFILGWFTAFLSRLNLFNKEGKHARLTLRPVPLWTTGTRSSPVKELMSSFVGSLQRCLLCLGRSTKPCNRPAPDCRVKEKRPDRRWRKKDRII